MQVAATLGFVLGRRNGQFLKGLRPKEVDAIREILVWGRQPLNNKILGFFLWERSREIRRCMSQAYVQD